MDTFGEWVALVLEEGIERACKQCPIEEAELLLDSLEAREEVQKEFGVEVCA